MLILPRRKVLQGLGAGTLALSLPFEKARAGLFSGVAGGGGGPTPYTGMVGTRAIPVTAYSGLNHQVNSRHAIVATDNITTLAVEVSNLYLDNSAPGIDYGPGASATITCSVEYPLGTRTQILFSGIAAGSVASARSLVSDFLSINIPNGATFWVWQFYQCTGGIIINFFQDAALGDQIEYASSGLTDKTLSGTITNAGNASFPPLRVLGLTTKPSVLVIGDSIAAGYNGGSITQTSPYDGRNGLICKSFASTLAFLNYSSPDTSAQSFQTNCPNRWAKITEGYYSHLVSELSANDIQNGSTAAATLGYLQTIWAAVPAGKPIIQTTLTPKSSSTDSWATTVNQTALNHAAHLTLNTSIRSSPSGLTGGYWETCNACEPVADDGLWINAASGPSIGGVATADGLHPSDLMYAYLATTGCINTSMIHYP